MTKTQIFLFGRFCLECEGQKLLNFESQKIQELLCYLLIYRSRPHPREKLATLLWCDCSTTQSKRYLRQALWQLQTCLEQCSPHQNTLLLTEPDWLQIAPEYPLWLDVAQFEAAYVETQGQTGSNLTDAQVCQLTQAVQLYKGDLLENWYQDWCLFERERLQNMYLIILDKLMGYCEVHHRYEEGITYGQQILRCDYARESTHRRLMRFHYLLGDRTGALRQYEHCAAALDKELNIKPSAQTLALQEYILSDNLNPASPSLFPVLPPTDGSSPILTNLVDHLHQLRHTLIAAQQQVEQEIETVLLLNQNPT
ncbi:MAG: bacterial transcriptional activator domain-containing protein [Anaerolineae bacterium]|nr:bacterial transcriptional activator domain-containing protein [Anaerolineae bacterium]